MFDKCPVCENVGYEKCDTFYEEGYLVEYSIRCDNCKTRLGTWAYGSWFDNEDLNEN